MHSGLWLPDAWSVAAWMRDADRRGMLEQYLKPPLTLREQTHFALFLEKGFILVG